MSSIIAAKQWWKEHVNTQPVWRTEDLSQVDFKDILISLKLAYEIRRDLIVLGKPNTESSVLIRSYFWEILACLLKNYAPYAISGITAMRLYLGDESLSNEIDVLTKSSSNRIDIHGISHLLLEKKLDFFNDPDNSTYLKTIETKKGYSLILETPESLLVRLRPKYFRDYPQLISGFLKGIDFDNESLAELLLQKSRPIIYLRLAALFEQVGKKSEAELLTNIIKATTHYSKPSKTQAIKIALPPSVATPRSISDAAYVVRFRDQLRYYADSIDTIFKNVTIPHWNLNKIISYAEKTKQYDTYHSSTIEGYRVSPEEIQLLMDEAIIPTSENREEIERKMAIKGYLEAYQYILQQIQVNFKKDIPFTEFTIREIYAHLFSPSVEAGILKKELLVQYRNDAVYIRNSRYVTPNYQKVNDLMRCLVEQVNVIENKVVQSIIAHYGFVTVHPYFDGNGRLARFLMNFLLSSNGIPWITIRIEDREKYFKALEIAQCDDNILPFANFMKNYVEEAKYFSLNKPQRVL